MAEERSARNDRAELVTVMRVVLEDIAERRAAEKAERRGRLRIVTGGQRRRGEAA